jgi:uncharacterized protein (TIGR03067 family)
MNLPFVGILLACLWLPAQAPKEAQAKKGNGTAKEVEKLQGIWQAVSWIEDGEKQEDVLPYIRWTFKGKKLTTTKAFTITKCGGKTEVIGQGGSVVSVYKINTTGKVPAMEARVVEVNGQAFAGETTKWIYRLEGDTLTICGSPSGTKPTDFTAEAGSGRILIVLKRKKS